MRPVDPRWEPGAGNPLAGFCAGGGPKGPSLPRPAPKDTETWTSLPWVKHYDKAKLGKKVVLFSPSPSSFVLVFPASPQQ